MRPRRALVCALADSAIAAVRVLTTGTVTTSPAVLAAAALRQQRRSVMEQSRPAFAAQRRRSSARKSSAKADVPGASAPDQTVASSWDTARAPLKDPEPRSSATANAQQQHLEDASPLKVAEEEAVTEATTSGSGGGGTLSAHTMLDTGRDAAQKQERLRLAKLRYCLLVGAHSAMQSTAGEDCRAHAPSLTLEKVNITSKSATPVSGSSDAESSPTVTPSKLCVKLPSPVQRARCGAISAPSATEQLSVAEALRVFANTFALTLHSTPQKWRTRVSAATAPVLPVFSGPSTIPIAGAPLSSSFLCSPLAIVAAPAAVSSVAQRTIAVEETAPLRWLETSFLDLCERLLRELYDEHAAATQRHDLFGKVQGQAAVVLRAVDKECRAVNSHVLHVMRRQCRRDAAAKGSSTTGGSSRKRKLSRVPKDTSVEDTLQNTLERVGQELHLVHAWIIHLCCDDGAGAAAAAAAVCVARRALRWDALRGAAATSTVTLDDVRWLFAVALLEHLHTQTYCFHHAKTAAADHITDAAAAAHSGKTRMPSIVVEAHHLRGLAALIDFAMAQRLEVPLLLATQLYSRGTAAFSLAAVAQQEALLDVIMVYHALLPTYALLFPSYHRVVVVAATPSLTPHTQRYTARETHSATPRELVLDDGEADAEAYQVIAPAAVDYAKEEDGNDVGNDAARELADRGAAAASPLRVWDVLVQHWERQQEQVRNEGAAAVVWWLRMLPLWISTATDSLQLCLILVSSSSGGGSGGDAVRTAEPMKELLDRAAAVLRDALRFDRREYERSRGAQRRLTMRSASARSDASPLGDEDGVSTGNETGKADKAGDFGTAAAGAAGATEAQYALANDNGLPADAPPPLRRQRGKRSLFYKSPHESDGGVLVRESQGTSARGGANGVGSSARSRFESRSRTTAGLAARYASSATGVFGSPRGGADGHAAGACPGRHGRAASAEAAADRYTSPIFQTLVLSSETPVVLSTLFRLDAVRRQSCLEEAWAAIVHSQSELWRLLYNLPPAAGAASDAARDEKVDRTTFLRNVLPVAVASLVGTAAEAASGINSNSSQRRAAATSSSARVPVHEETLRRVLCTLQSAQEQLGLPLFESLHHVLVSVAQVLLRIERVSDRALLSCRTPQDCTAGKRAPLDHVHQRQAFTHVLTIGTAILLAGNSLPWESAQVAWQLQQQQLRYPQIEFRSGAAVPQLPRPRFVSAAMDAFAVQWTRAIVKDLSLLHVSCRQYADVVLANALEMLRVLQTPSTSAALPLFAKQVTAVALLRSLSVLAGQWRQRMDAAQKGFRVHRIAGLAEVQHDKVMQLHQGVLDLLRDNGALRLLCGYATFAGELFEIHVRLKAKLASLVKWADMYLLPSLLPVVVAGLHRSRSTHNAATHADMCEATLGLLSQLSRYAANPQMSVVEVVRTQWNQVLLQVSLYCIRTAGRGGRKRAPDYGLPPPVLPSLDDVAALQRPSHGTDAAAAAREWAEAFTGGREPLFLALLDRSEALLGAPRGTRSSAVEVAEGATCALSAYIAAWDEQVRFGRCDWDATRPVSHEGIADDPTVDTRELLAHLQVSYEGAQAFGRITSPAFRASAEVAPFMAAKPNNTRQLGFLVRFMEQHLRVQERLSRLSDDELESFVLPWPAKDEAVPPAVQAVPRPSPPLPPSSLAASAATVSETAPLVLLDFAGYLSSRSVWAMVTWACNIAETVVKIELKRYRHIPETVQAVATTAILTQLRAVPPPIRGAGKPPVNILRALLSLSDMVAGTTESLLGYHRRSVIRGLLSNPTRDQYRVVTFGLKQATAYVQEEARQYQGLGTRESGACDDLASAMADGDTAADVETAAKTEEVEEAYSADGALHFRTNADGTIDRTWLAAGPPGLPAPPRQQDVGIYYMKVWAAYAAQQRLRAAASEAATAEADAATATLVPYLRTDLNREYRFFLSCLVCLVDASMESALLYLRRLQGDGEEDIRLLVEAAISEVCRTVSAIIHSLLNLSPEVRRACCQREEAELLWASLCIVATISAVVPRDPQERFFTPRCTDAIGRVFALTRWLVDDAILTMATPSTTNDEADSNKIREGTATVTSEAGASLVHRPLTTALVRGAQLLLRDPHSSQRMAIRFAVRQRERDDLSAVLVALQVLVKSAAAYEPGRSLLHYVWAQLAVEVSQPLLGPAVATAAPPPARSAKSKKSNLSAAAAATIHAAPTELNVAGTVISRSEYNTVLRGLASVCAALPPSSGRGGKLARDTTGDAASESGLELATAGGSGVAGAGAGPVVCDVDAAVRHVVEDAAGFEAERRRCLNESASQEEWHYAGVANSDEAAFPAAGHGPTSSLLLHPGQDVASEHPAFSVAEVMESGSMPTTAIIDAVIAHAAATVRAAGGRSSLDVNSIPGVARTAPAAADTVDAVDDDPATAVGFLRLVREFQRHATELLSLVPLRDIVARPQVEVFFACMSLLHGTVSAAAEDKVWALMTSKWTAELLAPSESTFLQLQELELAKVRELRAVTSRDLHSMADTHSRGGVDGAGHGGGSSSAYGSLPFSAAVVDMFAAAGRAPTRRSAQSNAELSVLAAAERSMRHHWCAEEFDLPRHDDVSRLFSNAGGVRKGPRNAGKDHRTQQRNGDRASTLELDPQATGMAALAAMPDPIPIPVVLTIFKVLSRRPVEHAASGSVEGLSQTFDVHGGGMTSRQIAATTSWLAKGGSDGSSVDSARVRGAEVERDCFAAFAEVFLTYTARAYWLLRPRLGDNAWVVWAIMEKSMAVYPTDNGVRQREWDRVCRQWRLPVSLDRAHAVAGHFFTEEQRRRISAWTAALHAAASGESASTSVSTKTVDGAEEVAVLRYLQAAALYLHLLAMTLLLLSRLGIFGDLPKASVEVVRRRVQAQVLQHRLPGSRSAATTSSAFLVSNEALTRELTLMALERQTQPLFVNRNLFEGAVLQFLNVIWCIVRHADSLTHTATDVVVARLQVPDPTASMGSAAAKALRATPPTAVAAAAIVSYADHVRIMVVGVVQDTLDMVTGLGCRAPAMLPQHAVKSLLTSGFSCEPLTLRLPAHRTRSATTTAASSMHSSHSSTRTDHTTDGLSAPAVHVIATHLSTTASVSSAMVLEDALLPTPASAAALLSATPELAVSSVFNPVARPELFVGSPTMLAILSPQFVRSTICRSLDSKVTSSTLLPVAFALEFYLSRQGVPLAPLLEATTELLTACTLRNSAVHMYCEHLASELTSRKEFRQALAPPTIASAEQGAAGSISNEVVISFLAAIARQDVLVTKKTLAHLLHSVMRMRPDVFGQPPTENRQGKLTLVQVGTTVDSAIDTTNPLYTPAQPAAKRGSGTGAVTPSGSTPGGSSDADGPRDAAAVMNAFNLEKWSDATAMTHRKALAALTISLPTVVEVAMHMNWMRPLDSSEWRRAIQMLKAADEARRERVAVHRSQAQAAMQQGRAGTEQDGEGSAGKKGQITDSTAAAAGKLDASLRLEDPFDFGVGMLHLRYALRKIVHASLRRLLHQQGPRMLADVASMLQMVDPALQRATSTAQASSSVAGDRNDGARNRRKWSSPLVHGVSAHGAGRSAEQPRPFDGVLAGTTRVLLSRAVLCAQAIGYDSTGAALEMSPRSGSSQSQEAQPVLKLPVPALQPSVVEAAISATASAASQHLRKGRHVQAGHSTGKIGLLSKEEKATVHQRVELERDAATTVGLTTAQLPPQSARRIARALRFTRHRVKMKQRQQEYRMRREKPRLSISAAPHHVSSRCASVSETHGSR
ncbi:conserved hypothetical protein [Leishmania major strain Friedlin]|uniref:Separase n=1 Tax=Leishmania major TaxID=5664 RepID=Q4QEN3_LEIMA|nr:conserved hypothetical protein [Leishmania major strain Friedlin]CAG9572175.1 hypothetical_protein_-_conserved [Leishmania major strain Friedlin]CAJ04020.1 conserved hypothetical protein [Leishmania major strain Friedlin]|eukprot:XP_001682215.1 conserved hypothetical protein [Leishmania major strain Friedlin]